ncbi:hypothetical protein [Streptomyces bicolor]|uniref:hypothetical protein n=1 Tax=Streptomyces bicolor TaxID=66874 RepID=UPI001F16CB90|nr:hypothetical protein [Streptomyces bicolor]
MTLGSAGARAGRRAGQRAATEAEVGVPLLEPVGRRVRLTEQAEILVAHTPTSASNPTYGSRPPTFSATSAWSSSGPPTVPLRQLPRGQRTRRVFTVVRRGRGRHPAVLACRNALHRAAAG